MLTNNIREFAVCDFEYVKNHLIDCRAKARLPKGARSIIVAAFPYKVNDTPPKNISRYAAVPDYHTVCGRMLESAAKQLSIAYPENSIEKFIDNSPIPEVAAAVRAGLGKRGNNGLLIHKKYGSFVFLGEIVTDLELPPEITPETEQKCLDCSRCKSACPSRLNKATCLSAVNQKKNGLTEEETCQIAKSGCVWGCDICSNVCPLNAAAHSTYITEFISGYRNEYTPTEDQTGRAYNWRGEEVVKRNYDIINGKK